MIIIKERILTGLQPSGELTLGNYIGSLTQVAKYQDIYDSFIFIPDLHSITVEQDPKLLKERIIKNIALYIACGISPEKNTIFIQSENLYHTNLSWILECNSYMGQLSRMTQFKDKSAKNKNILCGLFTYPILMASDILLYDAKYVPVGIDQKQHVELARDIAIRFNNKYGETFIVPEPIIPEFGAKIMDLKTPTKKMSKSSDDIYGTIFLLDTKDDIIKKIKRATTDSQNSIYFDIENKPGISNLLTIYSSINNLTIDETTKHFKNYNYGDFKMEIAISLSEFLEKIQNKYNEVLHSNYLNEILDKSRDRSINIAKEKYEDVAKKVGLGRY